MTPRTPRPPVCPICRRRFTNSAAAVACRDNHSAARALWWAVRNPSFYRWLRRRRTTP